LVDDLRAALVDEGLLFPQRGNDDLFIARVDEVTSEALPSRSQSALLLGLR